MWQLSGRVIEIQNYVKRPGLVISNRDFTLKDIPKIEKQIEEMRVGISAIEKFRRESKKKPSSKQEVKECDATEAKSMGKS